MGHIINNFTGGCISDIDKVNVQNNVWTFPTMNIQCLNKKGQGLIVTTHTGNTKMNSSGVIQGHQGEEFQLTRGYIILGACQYDGIAYLLSICNDVNNQNYGYGEIGSFPSPDPNTHIIDRTYRPLYNYDNAVSPGVTPGIFNDLLFNFDVYHQIDCFARAEYDQSVNIYFCDYKNNNRVINSGFDKTGAVVNHLYCPKDFGSLINHIPLANGQVTCTLLDIEPLGVLKYGNYFVYVRFSTIDFNPTHWLAEFGPFAVFDGGGSGDTIGNTMGGDHDKESNKKISIQLDNVDDTYTYVEVALVRYYSDETGVILSECTKINNYYKISGTTLQLDIIGNESGYPLTEELLLQEPSLSRISKTHTHLDKRYFGSNWKDLSVHNQELVDFAQLVRLSFDDDGPYETPQSSYMSLQSIDDAKRGLAPIYGGYKDCKLILHNVGYFRTESYGVGIVAKLKNGMLSEVYPTKGIDALTLTKVLIAFEYNTGGPLVNDKGIIRFPSNKVSPMLNTLSRGQILALEVDFTYAMPNVYPGSWIEQNVEGFYIVRTERNKNLQYQGIMSACSMAYTITPNIHPYTYWYSLYDNSGDPTMGIPNVLYFWQAFQPYGSTYEDDWIGSAWGKDIKFGQPAYWNTGGYTVALGHNFNLVDSGNGGIARGKQKNHYYKEGLFPFWRGYAPMHHTWTKMKADSVPGGDERVQNINYQTRWIMYPNTYAFYSFDFLFEQMNNIEDCRFLYDIANTYPNYWDADPNDEENLSTTYNGSFRKLNFDDQNGIMPQLYFEDIKHYNYYTYLYKNKELEWSKSKIGEPENITYSKYIDSVAKFLNETTDCYSNKQEALYWAHRHEGKDKYWTVRSSLSPKYIGLVTDQLPINNEAPWFYDATKNYNLDIVGIYKQDPHAITDITVNYNIRDEKYYKITDFIDISSLTGAGLKQNVYRGDCFLGRNYFKQRYWTGSNFGGDETDIGYDTVGINEEEIDHVKNGDFSMRFAHGLIIGVVTENENNIALRHKGETTRFWPQADKLYDFAITPYNTNGIESLLLNKGYNRTLGAMFFRHYNPDKPFDVQQRKVRTFHSDKHIEGGFRDMYRSIMPTSYKDYDIKYGQIMRTLTFMDNLVSVQEDAIIQHSVNEQQIKAPTTAGELVMGIGTILAEQKLLLAEYGSQHEWSVVAGTLGIYGWDWKRNIIWCVKEGKTAMGNSVLSSANLSTTKSIEKELFDIKDTINSLFTDHTEVLDDTPIIGNGISSGYDFKNKMIYFTLQKTTLEGKIPVTYRTTLCFNELLDFFTGNNKFDSPFYFGINSDFFMSHSINNVANEYFHMADQPITDYSVNMFYNVLEETILSLYIKGQESDPVISKIWNSYDIHSNEQEFEKVIYETEHQQSIQSPFDSLGVEFWRDPVYAEHKWHCPINVKTDPMEYIEYETDSEMRGTYLKMNLYYKKSRPQFIKNIISYFIPSKY